MTKRIAAAVFACLLPAAPAAEPDITVTLAKDSLAQAYTGRVYVQVMPALEDAPPEPRLANRWIRPPWLFVRDVEVWDGRPLSFAGLPDEACFPGPLPELPAGDYRAQAFVRLDPFSPDPGRGPADLVSAPVDFSRAGGSADAPEVALVIDHHPERPAPEDSERVRWIELRSQALSDFYGFDYPMQAGVVLPIDWDPSRAETFPVLVYIGGFGDDHVSGVGHITRFFTMFEQAVVIVPNPLCRNGHSVFVDSEINGPWGTALMTELLPEIDHRFGLAGAARRHITGISSGGWTSLWLPIRWPGEFRHAWALVPDPVDFRDFQGVDIYRGDDNFFTTPDGDRRPLTRGEPNIWYDDFVRHEDLLGPGMQIHSIEAAFSHRGDDGGPRRLIDRRTGAIDPEVAEAFERFDVSRQLRERWEALRPDLDGRITVVAGGQDTFFLEGAVRLLQETVDELDAGITVRVIEDMGHSPHRPTLEEMARVMATHPAALSEPGRQPDPPSATGLPRGWIALFLTALFAIAIAALVFVRRMRCRRAS